MGFRPPGQFFLKPLLKFPPAPGRENSADFLVAWVRSAGERLKKKIDLEKKIECGVKNVEPVASAFCFCMCEFWNECGRFVGYGCGCRRAWVGGRRLWVGGIGVT